MAAYLPGSNSAHADFLGCRKYYWLTRVRRDRLSFWAYPRALGTVTHWAIERFLRDGEWPTFEEHPDWRERLRTEATRLSLQAAEWLTYLNVPERVLPEMRLAFKLDERGRWVRCAWDDPDVYWRAVLDLVWQTEAADGTMELNILDWKTGRVMLDLPEQLRGYGVSAAKVSTAPRIRVHVVHLRYGLEGHSEELLERDGLDVSQALIDRRQAAIASLDPKKPDEWTATPGYLCSECPDMLGCKAFKRQQKAIPIPTTPEAAVKLFEAQAGMKNAAANMNRFLEDAVNRLGPVPLANGRVLDFWLKERWTLDDPVRFLSILAEWGVSPAGFIGAIGLSRQAVFDGTKGIRGTTRLRAELLACGHTETTTELAARLPAAAEGRSTP